MPTWPVWPSRLSRREAATPWLLWGLPVGLGMVAASVFLARPEIDLSVARAFYAPGAGFVGDRLCGVRALREAFKAPYFGTIVLCLVGLVQVLRGRTQWLQLGKAQWLFLAACLVAGPGLVANLVFKDHWGRARPQQIVEFGGSKAFTSPLVITSQCPRNCSFVSGEASSMYVTFYAAAALLPQWSVALAIAGTVGGMATGLVRMSQGAHFLSDVGFGGVFMAVTVLALRALMLRADPAPRAQPSPRAPGPRR